MTITRVPPGKAEFLLTEDDLPCSDGIPMESYDHVLQMDLLMAPLQLEWADRTDVFIGGNMFVYFSPNQVKTHDFRGPDVFVAVGVIRRSRKSWVKWTEKKPPDVVIELLSATTNAVDRTEKKLIYQDRLQAPEYYWYDVPGVMPAADEWVGFRLRDGVYQRVMPDEQGIMESEKLGLGLTLWSGRYRDVTRRWMRWARLDGELLPTPEETAAGAIIRAEQAADRAEQEFQRAEQEFQRAERLAARLREMGIDPDAG